MVVLVTKIIFIIVFFYNFNLVAQETNREKAIDLVQSARILLEPGTNNHPLEARTKLLEAVRIDPTYFPAHMALSDYYMSEVGHFRLALQYIKQAEKIFFKQRGNPPYPNFESQSDHAWILSLLSQARLNLDDYTGALKVLDKMRSLGYFSEFYLSSRAWILMKLGKIKEAIQEIRYALLLDPESGRSLNMLGILLSVNGQPKEALATFDKAIRVESSRLNGQIATPLNNAGEVLREQFKDELAKDAWIRAKRLPDGCEHVLPSLNLAILYLEQEDPDNSESAMLSFEECFKQYPLRNDDEHRALVNLAYGRIALYRGAIDSAINYFEDSLKEIQWFGKIGANKADLELAIMISLSQALKIKNNHLQHTYPSSFFERVNQFKLRIVNYFKSRWLIRKARFLATDLNNFEDLKIRHTDSLLDYVALGFFISSYNYPTVKSRILQEINLDKRRGALPYYESYLGEAQLNNGELNEGNKYLNKALNKLRTFEDRSLYLKILTLKLKYLTSYNSDYLKYVTIIMQHNPAILKNYGVALPINLTAKSVKFKSILEKVGFIQSRSNFTITATENSAKFVSKIPNIPSVESKGNNIIETINNLSKKIFTPFDK
jgi:Tfp pilus assembly protein PilF